MMNRHLSKGWESWQFWYAELKAQQFKVAGAIRRMLRRKLSMAWEQWQWYYAQMMAAKQKKKRGGPPVINAHLVWDVEGVATEMGLDQTVPYGYNPNEDAFLEPIDETVTPIPGDDFEHWPRRLKGSQYTVDQREEFSQSLFPSRAAKDGAIAPALTTNPSGTPGVGLTWTQKPLRPRRRV